jgi:hypothetical protein
MDEIPSPSTSPEQARAWIAQWRSAAIALERVKADEVAHANCIVIAAQLEDVSLAAIARNPPRPTSGLIEQQRILHRVRRA